MTNFPTAITTHCTESPEEAAGFIQHGMIAAFPTETVYGLGASVFDSAAVQAIFDAKERPADNPLIAHIHSMDQIKQLASEIPPIAQQLINQFFPGPLTVILKRAANIPDVVTAGLETIAIRMPAHPIAQKFLQACADPVVAPSANRSGRPSPTTWQDVYADMKGRIPCILKAGASEVGLESTVVDCTSDIPQLLRTGGIPIESLRAVAPDIILATKPQNGVAKSPGMKYRHYAPNAQVHIATELETIPTGPHFGFIGLQSHVYPEQMGLHMQCTDVQHYANQLFSFFRRCDRAGVQHIYCQAVDKAGLGLALMDRIEKAADIR